MPLFVAVLVRDVFHDVLNMEKIVDIKLEIFFDLMFDATNETEGLPVEEIQTDFDTKSFVERLEDGNKFVVKCTKQRN